MNLLDHNASCHYGGGKKHEGGGAEKGAAILGGRWGGSLQHQARPQSLTVVHLGKASLANSMAYSANEKRLSTFSRLSNTKAILLTIDDGPNPETTPLLLNTLARYRAKANFFVCGKNVAANPELARLIVSSGHNLLSHGFSHRDFTTLTGEEIIDELEQTERLLSGFRPTPSSYLIRLPYGRGFDVPHVNAAVAKWRKDAAFVQWNLTPAEWQFVGNCLTPSDVSSHCERAVQDLSRAEWGGGIMLLHDWATVIESESPKVTDIRPYFCAVLLEKILITARNKNLDYALL